MDSSLPDLYGYVYVYVYVYGYGYGYGYGLAMAMAMSMSMAMAMAMYGCAAKNVVQVCQYQSYSFLPEKKTNDCKLVKQLCTKNFLDSWNPQLAVSLYPPLT